MLFRMEKNATSPNSARLRARNAKYHAVNRILIGSGFMISRRGGWCSPRHAACESICV